MDDKEIALLNKVSDLSVMARYSVVDDHTEITKLEINGKFDKEIGDYTKPTEEQLNETVYFGKLFSFRSRSDKIHTIKAKNGVSFSCREILEGIERVEKENPIMDAPYGIDHVYFEQFHVGEHGVPDIFWGS